MPPHRDSLGYYKLLRVEPDAAAEQIQLSFEMIEELSPNQRGAPISEIEHAYSVLKNPATRQIYDRAERAPQKQRSRKLDDVRLLVACLVVLVGILGFVWYPLYGGRLRSFSAGDHLVDIKGAAFGVVVQTKELHAFPNQPSAPAYLIQTPRGELRWFPAADIQSVCRRAE